jgi:DNA repair exonuclease SbcCD ATPase subunit
MRLSFVTLRNYRLHREVRVGFDPSRTLIGGQNEAGKSTLVEAVHRALFLKAKGNTEFHRAMISSLHSGNPEVELAFEESGVTYLLRKRFGPAGTTTLAPSNAAPLSGDSAENRLADVLGVESGVSGKAVAIQWGHLWVWQGEAGRDPSSHATAQQGGLLQRLQKMGGAAALQSPLDDRVARHFSEIQEQIYKQGGKPKAESELEKAELAQTQAQGNLELALDRVRKLNSAAADLETASRTLVSTSASLAGLETEFLTTEATERNLSQLQKKESEQSHDSKGAMARYNALLSASQQIRKIRQGISDLDLSLKPQREAIAELEKKSLEARQKAAAAETANGRAFEAARAARIRRDLASAHVLFFEKEENHTKVSERIKKVRKVQRDLDGLEGQLAKLAKVDKAKLHRIQKLATDCSNARSALQAMATGIEVVAADKGVKAGGKQIKVGQRRVLTEDTELVIGSNIRLRIEPGGGTSLADARQLEAEAAKELQEVLDSFGLQTVKDAIAVNSSREELASSIKSTQSELDGMAVESLEEELRDAQNDLVAAKANVVRLAALAPDIGIPKDKAAARVLANALAKKLGDAESQETEAKTAHDRAAKQSASADQAMAERKAEADEQMNKLTGLNAQLELLLKTHGDDEALGRALLESQLAQSGAQKLLNETTAAIANLQPDLLQADHERIARALKEKTSEQNEARTQMAVAKASLSSDGSEDPAADVATAKARASSAGEHLIRVRRYSQAILLLDRLFQDEQRSLARQFTQPFADRISGYLQCIFGAGALAQVDLDSNEFTGLRLSRLGFGNSPFEFDNLSGGTREQTAAAVRLAMAEVLAADHGGCLPVIFDDAFAYADPERVNQLQRMLDLAATRGLQVIVLTCNPSDYASLGAKTVTLRPERFVASNSGNPVTELGLRSPDGSTSLVEDPFPNGSPSITVTDELRQSFLSTLSSLGGSKGNQSLREDLGWDEATYFVVKNDLVNAGRLLSGKGRGGSVSLPGAFPQ